MATLETIFYEREQDPILFVIAVEESTDMTSFIELGTGKGNRSGGPLHGISPHRISSGAQFNKDAPI
jgi:hypothetical protein